MPTHRSTAAARQPHLLIAGTGRAGTSFLVRYLDALGLDTHLSRRRNRGAWDEAAQAGLEDLPVTTASADMPYVVKSPWAYEVAQEMLADPALHLDAAILPMRDIVEAAASRTVLELRALHEQAPWMADLAHTWETWGRTPGGTVYSLHPMDQARLLALGFHRLVDRLTAAGVPMVFLAFPRFVEDADYLYDRLRTVLPAHTDREAARAAHAAVADSGKVRLGAELSGATVAPAGAVLQGPSLADLDRIALTRELARQRGLSSGRRRPRLQQRLVHLGRRLGQYLRAWTAAARGGAGRHAPAPTGPRPGRGGLQG